MDAQTINQTFDLLPLCGDLKQAGAYHVGACPFCGGRDRFRVQPHARRWLCRGCTGGKWQDAIAYVMRRRNCDFREACESLAANSDFRNLPDFGSLATHSHTPVRVEYPGNARQGSCIQPLPGK